jgi:hypothetical protein
MTLTEAYYLGLFCGIIFTIAVYYEIQFLKKRKKEEKGE